MSETLSLRERIQALPDGHRLVWYPATHQLNTTTDELKALAAALDAAEQRERDAVVGAKGRFGIHPACASRSSKRGEL
jgi:hypothetical protein